MEFRRVLFRSPRVRSRPAAAVTNRRAGCQPAPHRRHTPGPEEGYRVLPEPLLPPIPRRVRRHFGHIGGALSARPLAPEAGGFHPAFLDRRGTTGGGGAPAACAAALVAASATGQHGTPATGHRPTAPGPARASRARSRDRAGYFGVD